MTNVDKSSHLRVISFEPDCIQIEISDLNKWKLDNTGLDIKIGSFIKVHDGDERSILCLVKSFKMIEFNKEGAISQNDFSGKFIICTQPIGQILYTSNGSLFTKGIKNISIPPNGVSVATSEDLMVIFSLCSSNNITFAEHLVNSEIKIGIDGDKFFSKHVAVVGSTGSGKSCTVAKIIQEAKKCDRVNINNTHVIIFDIHGEYQKAFPDSNYLSIEKNNFKLPYWLMNSEELEDMFIESNEQNSHNQVSQFKYAVIENKKKYNPDIKVTYDSPVFFSLLEVYNYIVNKNNETQYNKAGKDFYATTDFNKETSEKDVLWKKINFETSSGNSKHNKFDEKVSAKGGGFNGEFNRFVSRLDTTLNDERLQFMISECKEINEKYSTNDLQGIVEKILGYSLKKNVTIIDLSSLPFEVVSIVVSIISRLIFEFSYHNIRVNGKNETPFMLVYEEAHKYIPKNNEVKFKNTRIAVERIAKEGRKYGISAMIVSQRPSELSSTVFSQCNNFVVMRLNNPEDQSYVKRLLPEAVVSFGDALSSLEQREALIVGDAISTPCIAKIMDANPTPNSDDIKFYTEWKEEWKDVVFGKILKNINKDSQC